jgi:hypothetical protein
MKKLLCVIFTFIILTGAASAAYATTDTSAGTAGKSYTDVKTTNWAYESVNAMSEKGILKGYADGTFKPSNTVTYGEFIKMALIGATNEDIGNSSSGNWAKSYYDKALELGYFGSTDIKVEQLNNIITRSDMALIISNILGETKIDDYDKLDQSVSDVDSTTKNDYDIIKSYATGILTGYADGTFKPEGTLTRAEAVTVIYRLVDESKRVLPVEKKEDANKPTSGTDIASVIKNYKTFEQISGEEASGSDFMEATSYEIITDMSVYQVTLGENRGTKWIDINGQTPLELGWGNLYLMKDNKIIEFTSDGIYKSDITTIEYFVFPRYKNVDHVIGLMPNPLYKGN